MKLRVYSTLVLFDSCTVHKMSKPAIQWEGECELGLSFPASD